MADMYFENLPSTNTPLIASNLDKLNDIKVSATEPNTGEKVWLQKGKNLFDGILRQGNHVNTTTTNRLCNSNPIKAKGGVHYTVSTNLPDTYSVKLMNCVSNALDATIINDGSWGHTSANVYCGQDGYLKVLVKKDDDSNLTPSTVSNYHFMVEQGSTATAYEAYIEPEIYTKNNNNVYEKLLLGKDIVESGSNYIKYIDGTLICFDKKAFTKTWTSDNSRITIDNPFTFPVVFNGNPAINMFSANDDDYAYCLIYGCLRNSKGITSVNLFRFNSVTNGTVVLHYIAIGRWK